MYKYEKSYFNVDKYEISYILKINTKIRINQNMEEGEILKLDKKKLEIAMANACMTTAKLQKAAEMPRPTLDGALAGKNVRPATAGKIAKALEVPVTEIIE